MEGRKDSKAAVVLLVSEDFLFGTQSEDEMNYLDHILWLMCLGNIVVLLILWTLYLILRRIAVAVVAHQLDIVLVAIDHIYVLYPRFSSYYHLC